MELQKTLLYKIKASTDRKYISLQNHCFSDNYLPEHICDLSCLLESWHTLQNEGKQHILTWEK